MSNFKKICITNRKLCKGYGEFGENVFIKRLGIILSDSYQYKPDMLILREKDLDDEAYRSLAVKVKKMCDDADVHFVAHSHIEAAREITDSIHLPLPILSSHKENIHSFKHIGASCHSGEEAEHAIGCGCTYITAGHIYTTDCKKGLPARGLSFLREMCDNSPLPVYAIGGIGFEESRFKDLREAGAAGACIMSAYM